MCAAQTERLTFEDAMQDFYDDQLYKGNSPSTLRFYKTTVDRFRRDAGVHQLEAFNERTIRIWLMSHEKVSRVTLATYDRCLRVVSRWLYRRGYTPQNAMALLPKPKARAVPITTFTESDIKTMIRVAKNGREAFRDVALITMLLDTGLRIGEVMSLKLHDIQWREGWLQADGKTGPRMVPFGQKCRLALKRYIDQGRKAADRSVQTVFTTRDGRPMSVPTATHHLVKIARATSTQASKVGPHTFRHTFALEFIRAGGDAFSLQRLLGHTTLDMTRRYVHLADSDLRTAHKRFAPADRIL